jgi:hypothetical protein
MPVSATSLSTRLAVEDAIVRLFVATDERDWDTLKQCFTDPFTLDMTSMIGGEPIQMTPTQVANAWAQGFKPLDSVHHQVGNFRTEVKGNQAVVKCYGIALHHREKATGEKSRRFVGTYEFDLARSKQVWQVHRLLFKLKFIDGNLDLEK